jgi:hypothetical protein
MHRYGTSSPDPVFGHIVRVTTPALAEKKLFNLLKGYHHKKEFFKAPLSEIVTAMNRIGKEFMVTSLNRLNDSERNNLLRKCEKVSKKFQTMTDASRTLHSDLFQRYGKSNIREEIEWYHRQNLPAARKQSVWSIVFSQFHNYLVAENEKDIEFVYQFSSIK